MASLLFPRIPSPPTCISVNVLGPPPSPPPPDPLGVCLPCAVPMMTPVCDCAAEVIGTAFFDVEMDALDYSVEDDGSLNLSERPYLQVCFTSVCLIRQPCQPGVWSQDLWRVREGGGGGVEGVRAWFGGGGRLNK